MENVAVKRLMRLIDPLSIENKLDILLKLSENLKTDLTSKKNDKEDLLNDLFGVWSQTDDILLEDILQARTISNKDISFE